MSLSGLATYGFYQHCGEGAPGQEKLKSEHLSTGE